MKQLFDCRPLPQRDSVHLFALHLLPPRPYIYIYLVIFVYVWKIETVIAVIRINPDKFRKICENQAHHGKSNKSESSWRLRVPRYGTFSYLRIDFGSENSGIIADPLDDEISDFRPARFQRDLRFMSRTSPWDWTGTVCGISSVLQGHRPSLSTSKLFLPRYVRKLSFLSQSRTSHLRTRPYAFSII